MVCFVLFGQSINNDFNIDDDYVYENHELVQKGIEGIPEIFMSRYNTRDEQYFGYRPLTIAIYAIEYQIFGNNPHTAHFFNILYYSICCSLLFYFLNLLLKDKYRDNYLWISFLISLIFATHAIHTEVVLSLKNREEIISLILGLASSIWALKYFTTKKLLWLLPAIAALALSFLAKESSVVFVILIPLSILFFKTDVKFLSGLKINLGFLRVLSKVEKIIYSAMILCIFLFLVLSPNIQLGFGHEIMLHNFKTGINEFVAWGMFLVLYFLTLVYRNRINEPIKANLRNIMLWAIAIILSVIAPIMYSTFAGFLTFFLLLFTLKHKTDERAPIIKINIIENKSTKVLLSIIGFLLLSSIVLALVYFIPKETLPETNAPVFKWQNPAFDYAATFSDKVAIALYSLVYYAKLMIIPFPLRFYYGYKMIPEVSIFNPIVLFSLMANLLMLIWSLRGFNKRNIIAYGYLFWFIAIFPLANTFFPLTGIIAERLLFVPSIGFSIIAVFLIHKITKIDLSNKLSRSQKILGLSLAMLIILPNAIISLKRNSDWKDRKTLYEHDIKYLENSAKANTLYGNLLIGEVYAAIKSDQSISNYKNQVELATFHFNKSVEIDSTYSNPWHNLGYISMILYKNYALAEKQFSNCLAVDSTIAAAYLNRGISNYYLENYKQSIIDFEDYLNKNKNYKDKEIDKAYLFTAKSHLALGDNEKCTEFYIKASQNLKKQNLTLAVLADFKDYFLGIQDFDNAIYIIDLEISLDPNKDIGYVDKGNYCLLSGDTLRAIENWEIAFEKFKGNFNIAMTLSAYYKDKGNIEKANYFYTEAVQFRANNPGKQK